MLKKDNGKKSRFSHIAMFVIKSETPSISLQNLCLYVLKIIMLNGLNSA